MMYKVKDHRNLVRDPSTHAVLNIDREARFQLKEKKETKVSIQSLQEEMNVIKDEFKEIKDLLRQIASRNH